MSSSNSLSSTSKPHYKRQYAESQNWRRLRRDIFAAVLYHTEPAKGVGYDIYTLVRLYYADFSKLPIEQLKSMLSFIANKKNCHEQIMFFDLNISLPVPKLPRYKKVNGSMVETTGPGLQRRNVWRMSCQFLVEPTQPGWKRDMNFVVIIRMFYKINHFDNHLPTHYLDSYQFIPKSRMKFKRQGKLYELIEQDTFLYHLRDLILTSTYRLKRQRLCQNIKLKGNRDNRKYQVCCGGVVPEGCDICRNCWRDSFKSFLSEI